MDILYGILLMLLGFFLFGAFGALWEHINKPGKDPGDGGYFALFMLPLLGLCAVLAACPLLFPVQ